MINQSVFQMSLAAKYGAPFLRCEDHLKVGISKSFDRLRFPINGMRHLAEGNTTGWYIWSGQDFSNDADFFVPVHAIHLNDRCPEIVKFLGLGPGWRFLFAPQDEDVWYDGNLLIT